MNRLAIVDVLRLSNTYCIAYSDFDGYFNSYILEENNYKHINFLLDNKTLLVRNLNNVCKQWLTKHFINVTCIDLCEYECPSLQELHCKQTCPSRYTCTNHGKGDDTCPLCNVVALMHWIKQNSVVKWFVSYALEKFIRNRFTTPCVLNTLEWNYIPASYLLLCAQRDIPRLWSVLPEHIKTDRRFKGLQYCEKHEHAPGGTQWDGPKLVQRQCRQCIREGVVSGAEVVHPVN